MSRHLLIRLLSRTTRKRAAMYLREEGIKLVWLKALERMGIYYRGILFVRQTKQLLSEVTVPLPANIDLLKETELNDYALFHTEPTRSVALDRLRTGHWCFVAHHEGRIVSAGWAVTNDRSAYAHSGYIHQKVAERLAPDEVYVYDGFTLPTFRRRYFAGGMLRRMASYFEDAGYKRMIIWVAPENRASLRLMEKTGFRSAGLAVHVLSFGPLKVTFYSTGPH